jgi:hypothetical protein
MIVIGVDVHKRSLTAVAVDKRGVAELKVQMPQPFSVSAVGWRTPSSYCQHSRRSVNWSNEGSASPEAGRGHSRPQAHGTQIRRREVACCRWSNEGSA